MSPLADLQVRIALGIWVAAHLQGGPQREITLCEPFIELYLLLAEMPLDLDL